MQSYFLVFLGGGIGSMARFLFSKIFASISPGILGSNLTSGGFSAAIGTFAANLTGCFLLGIILAFHDSGKMSGTTSFLLATGFCGGLTTFSSFIFELTSLQSQNKTYLSIGYFVASIIIAIVLAVSSYSISTKLLNS